VDGIEVVLERDDEGNLRAMLPENTSEKAIEKGLIEAIIEVFNALKSTFFTVVLSYSIFFSGF
jgi:hypothetical protein